MTNTRANEDRAVDQIESMASTVAEAVRRLDALIQQRDEEIDDLKREIKELREELSELQNQG